MNGLMADGQSRAWGIFRKLAGSRVKLDFIALRLTLEGLLCVDAATIREHMLQKFFPTHTLSDYHLLYKVGQSNTSLLDAAPTVLLEPVTEVEL